MTDQATCNHIWIANSGQGGEPRFNIRMTGDIHYVMHVRCCECGTRSFFSEKQWFALEEAQDSNSGHATGASYG